MCNIGLKQKPTNDFNSHSNTKIYISWNQSFQLTINIKETTKLKNKFQKKNLQHNSLKIAKKRKTHTYTIHLHEYLWW